MKAKSVKSWVKLLFAGLVICIGLANFAPPALAKPDAIYTSWRNNLAVGGYDVVSYFDGKPLKGNPKYQTHWRGADWLFVSQSNLQAFLQTPETYAPAYGGYCAWAVAKGKLAKGNPKYWTLRDGRLFLNFNERIQAQWLHRPDVLIALADRQWPGLSMGK